MSSRAALESLAQGLEQALIGVRKLIDAPDPEEWVDQTRSPLGRRRHCELARRGVLPGAFKDGNRWLVKRRNLDAYIERQQYGSGDEATEQAEILAFRAPARRGKRR